MRRRVIGLQLAAAAALAAGVILAVPGGGRAASSMPGCEAMAGSSCSFTTDTTTPSEAGYASLTSATWSITNTVTVSLAAPDPCAIVAPSGDTGHASMSSTSTTTSTTYTNTYTNTGVAAGNLTFGSVVGCSYTLAVGTGSGMVIAGDTN